MTKVSLGSYELAVCMDGTPAAYYWQPASAQESANVWIVHLEAGGWCTDKVACQARWDGGSNGYNVASNANLCSSRHWSETRTQNGVFYADNPVLRDANKVFLEYCTSDAHMGDTDASGAYDAEGNSDAWGWTDPNDGQFKYWQFRGNRVVKALFHSLVTTKGLGARSGTTLVFGGSSAGSRGAMIHLDYVPEMMGPAAASRTTVYGFLDSPMHLDHADARADGWGQCLYDVTCHAQSWVPSRAETARRAYTIFNASHLGPSCRAAFPGTEPWGAENEVDANTPINREWRCMMGHHRTKYVDTPYVAVASQYDSYLLRHDVGCVSDGEKGTKDDPDAVTGCDHTPATLRWAAEAANLTRALMDALPAHVSTVSWACKDHAGALGDNNFNHKYGDVYGQTMNAALTQMLAGNTSRWVDPCNGWACSIGCSGLRIYPPPPPAPVSWGTFIGASYCRDSLGTKDKWNTPLTYVDTPQECRDFAMAQPNYRGFAYAFGVTDPTDATYRQCYAYAEADLADPGGYPTQTPNCCYLFSCHSLEGVFFEPPSPPSIPTPRAPPVPPGLPPPPALPSHWGAFVATGKCRYDNGGGSLGFTDWALSNTGGLSFEGCLAHVLTIPNIVGYSYSAAGDACWSYAENGNDKGFPTATSGDAAYACYALDFPSPPPSPAAPASWGTLVGEGLCRYYGDDGVSLELENWTTSSTTGILSMNDCIATIGGLTDVVGVAYGPNLDSGSYHYQRCWLYRETGGGGGPVDAVSPSSGIFCYSQP